MSRLSRTAFALVAGLSILAVGRATESPPEERLLRVERQILGIERATR